MSYTVSALFTCAPLVTFLVCIVGPIERHQRNASVMFTRCWVLSTIFAHYTRITRKKWTNGHAAFCKFLPNSWVHAASSYYYKLLLNWKLQTCQWSYFNPWFTILTISRYHVAVSDVLTSVQRTEETLKRLRKDRVTSGQNGINDDDKIRMQLVIDVDAYVEATRVLLNGTTPEITALLDVVDSARQICHRNQPAN